mmetsp:Transcript_16187/g.27889  ORF Transcript_16187/g.27889 Transcript_16187/m.27889 type:complete len:503 (+) Transcript_16187:3-1511(+)
MSNALSASFLDDFDDDSGDDLEVGVGTTAGENGGQGSDGQAGIVNGSGPANDLPVIDPFKDVDKLCRDSGLKRCVENVSQYDLNPQTGPSARSRGYELVIECNKYCVEIDEELIRVHAIVSESYSKRFPELISHVPEPLDYIKAVKVIGNESDMTAIDLSGILSSAQSLAITMTGSKLETEKMDQATLEKLFHACDSVLELVRIKTSVLLPFVASQMSIMAPNLTAIIGSDVTAQLLAIVGGLDKLTKIPSCNVQVIGKGHSSLNGFSRVASMRHFGVIHACKLVQDCLSDHRRKAMRVVAGRVALAARLDATKSDPKGQAGQAWHEEIKGKLFKWHAPAPGKTKRALPVPVIDAKKKRGGKRARRMKELYGMTDVRKAASRVQFGEGDDEYGDSAMGKTLGLLGKEGSGRLRIQTKDQRKRNVDMFKYKTATNSRVAARNELLDKGISLPQTTSTTTSEASSSIAFITGQGIEIVNPAAARETNQGSESRYFGSEMKFNKK